MENKNTQLGFSLRVEDLVKEYDEKILNIEGLITELKRSEENLSLNSMIGATFVEPPFSNSYCNPDKIRKVMLKSAWRAAYNYCKIDIIAPSSDKQSFKRELEDPPEFTYENILATFGDYVKNPVNHILRGMAEIFCNLDPAYKSHSNVKVGVKGLPKRIIIENMRECRYSGWRRDSLRDLISALQSFDGDGITDNQIIHDIANEKLLNYRGLEFRWFKNGNLHIHFDKHACNQINRALALYYGEVLPDVEVKPDKPRYSTALSKDLQYYPTPIKLAKKIVNSSVYIKEGYKILEPSCGCGRLMDALKGEYPDAVIHGVEVNPQRVRLCKNKGYNVQEGNFLELIPSGDYDVVFMNPPFYGKHYLKHIDQAIKFLKPNGVIISILPATAHYDHKKLPSGYRWVDLPVGSFSESGTNVPTGYMIWRNK